MADKEFGPDKEFFSEWHRDAYVEGLKRELAGAVLRDDDAYAESVRTQLRRLGAEPKKGPGRPPKETRDA